MSATSCHIMSLHMAAVLSQMTSRHLQSPTETKLHLPLAHFRSHFGLCTCRFALQAPACRLAGVYVIRHNSSGSPLPSDWEEQATTALSTHPPWAAACLLHLDLLTKEVKHCKYILKTPRLVNTVRNDYRL